MAFTGIALFPLSSNGAARPLGRFSRSLGTSLAALGFALCAGAQAQLRCDLQVKSTPGAGAEAACLDLVAVRNGGTPIQTAGNATRISTDGFRLCKTAFQVSQPAGADIVFIYDNSGSMASTYARIDSATNDTSFYHAQSCGMGGGGPATTGLLTYNTLLGPRTIRTIAANVNCNQVAGDPYLARGRVITQAIDYLALTSSNSTAGAVAFSDFTAHARPPLLLSVPGNADLVKASIVLDSIPQTNYVPPLDTAKRWLNDTALTNTARKAIVFISDGEPNDGNRFTPWLAANTTIPIYTIALGDSAAPFTRMQDMSRLTGGQFFRVAPNNIALMNQVMQQIIQAITRVNLPTSIEISNSAFTPPMVSRSVGMTQNPDSSVSVVLDSIIALKKGPNPLVVKVTMAPGDVREYPVTIQADGTDAGSSTTSLECHRLPSLVMLNQNGGVDSSYPSGPTQYDVRLVRTTSDLAQVVVTATSRDSTKPGWGDEESITLPQTSTGPDSTVNRRENYPFNGGATAATKGDNTLQAAPDGQVILTWKHPRDEREQATFILPGRKVPTTVGFIDLVRIKDAPKGTALPGIPLSDPIVIRGGVTYVTNGENVVMTDKGDLHNPHKLSDAVLDPDNTPTFVLKTGAPFTCRVSIFDNLGNFLNANENPVVVDSATWEGMRGTDDSLAVAISIVPVSSKGQQFGTGVYILRADITTKNYVSRDPGNPRVVTPTTRRVINRFGYLR